MRFPTDQTSLLSKDRFGGLLILAFCCGYGLLSQDIVLPPTQQDTGLNARSLPQFLAVLGLTLSLALVLFPTSHTRPAWGISHWPLLFAFLLLMSLFGLAIRPLGFLISTSLFLFSGFALLGERSYLRLVTIPLAVAFAFWALMDLGLGVYVNPLPQFMER